MENNKEGLHMTWVEEDIVFDIKKILPRAKQKPLYKSKDVVITQEDVDKALEEAKKIDPAMYKMITAKQKKGE